MSTSQPTRNIVIIGGGIIGCTTAYYITRHPSFSPAITVTVIEASAHGAAQGASGKAGGLVAKWAYPRELVDVSFSEVSELNILVRISQINQLFSTLSLLRSMEAKIGGDGGL